MPDSDLMFRSANELAGMVRSGECSARELVELSLARIEELNPQLNAFVQIDAERALATAADIGPGDPRPFAGVPIAIKNNRAVQGLRLTYGCSLMKDFVDYDHNVTRRLKDAGFVIVGTTTLPEYGILPTTEARIFGPTRILLGSRAHPGRLLWRRRGRRRGGHAAGGARQRRRRLGADSRRVLRAGRSEARARAHLAGSRPRRLRARNRRHAHPQRRRHGGSAGRARGLRDGRRDLGAAAAAALRGQHPRAARASANRRDDAAADGRGDRRGDQRARRGRGGGAAGVAGARGRGGATAVAGRAAARVVRSGVLHSDIPLDRILREHRRARAHGAGHGADELGDLLDGRGR